MWARCKHALLRKSHVNFAIFVAASVACQVHDILSRPCSTEISVSQLRMTIPGQVLELSCKLDDESILGAVMQLVGLSCKLEMMYLLTQGLVQGLVRRQVRSEGPPAPLTLFHQACQKLQSHT